MRTKIASLVLATLAVSACAGQPPPPAEPPPPPPPVSVASAPVEAPPAETPDDNIRKQPPNVPARGPTRAPKVDEGRLSNGVRLLVVERHDAPIVSMQIVIPWGAAAHAPGAQKLWAASLLASPVKGAATLREALESAGGSPLVEADVDAGHIAVNCLGTQMEGVLDALTEALLHPGFTKEVVEKERTHLVEMASRISPRDHFRRIATEQLLPLGHPYRIALDPDEAEAGKLGLADVTRLHSSVVHPEGLTVVVVGDVTKATLIAQLEKRLATWKGKAAPATPLAKLGTSVHVLDQGDEAEADVAVVVPAVPRTSKDWFVATLVNQLAQEDLEQRLRERVTTSWSWSTARLDQTRVPGLWTFGLRVGKNGASAAVESFLAEHERLAKGEFSDDRLAATKRQWARWTETLLDRSSDTAWSLARIAAYGLAFDDLAMMRDAFVSTTRDDIKRVAATYLDRKLVRVVVSGDAKTVKDPLAKLSLGAPHVTKAPPKPKAAHLADLTGGVGIIGVLTSGKPPTPPPATPKPQPKKK
jgi:zinc protease